MDSGFNAEDFLNNNKMLIVVSLVGLVLLVGGIVSSGIIPKTFVKSTKQLAPQIPAVSGVSKSMDIKVDVSGAVASPGVYSLSADSRIEDALKLAGGVTKEADPVYVAKSINLAQKVVDGMKLYVPKISETPVAGTSSVAGTSTSTETGLININTASASELADKLLGVGPSTAQKIIDGRPYSGIEELLTKKAVSRTLYEKIKAQISTW